MRNHLLALLCPLVVAISGCGGGDGPALGTVTGKVTLDGQPVARLVITYIPEGSGGSPSYGVTNAQGEYTMEFTPDKKGAAIGKHQVTVEPGNPMTDENGKPLPDQPVVKVPGKYRRPGELTAEVKSGANTINFELSSK